MADDGELIKFLITPAILLILVYMVAVVHGAVAEEISGGPFKNVLVDIESAFVVVISLASAAGTIGLVGLIVSQFSR